MQNRGSVRLRLVLWLGLLRLCWLCIHRWLIEHLVAGRGRRIMLGAGTPCTTVCICGRTLHGKAYCAVEPVSTLVRWNEQLGRGQKLKVTVLELFHYIIYFRLLLDWSCLSASDYY